MFCRPPRRLLCQTRPLCFSKLRCSRRFHTLLVFASFAALRARSFSLFAVRLCRARRADLHRSAPSAARHCVPVARITRAPLLLAHLNFGDPRARQALLLRLRPGRSDMPRRVRHGACLLLSAAQSAPVLSSSCLHLGGSALRITASIAVEANLRRGPSTSAPSISQLSSSEREMPKNNHSGGRR